MKNKFKFLVVIFVSIIMIVSCRSKSECEKNGHKYKKEIVSATCYDEGYTINVCSICGDNYKDKYVPKLGHDIIKDEAIPATCTESGLTEGEHCTRCNYAIEQKKINPLGHDIVGNIVIEPTCLEDGMVTSGECTRCDYKTEQSILPALGHDIVIDERKEPTCLETGLTAGEHCTRCDHVIKQEVIEALKHDIVIDEKVEPTCTETGLTAGEHCTRCDYAIKQEVIEALKHDIVIDERKEPTCLETGLTAGEHCTRCDYAIKQEVIEALKHDIVIDERKEPTCLETGLTAGEHCTRCNYKISQTIIKELGHNIILDQRKEPTCLETGLTAGEHCTRCDYAIKQEIIEALGHTLLQKPAVEPTCTTAGQTSTQICASCKYVIPPQEIPALGHDYTIHHVITGYSVEFVAICGHDITHSKVVDYFSYDEYSTNFYLKSLPTQEKDGAIGYFNNIMLDGEEIQLTGEIPIKFESLENVVFTLNEDGKSYTYSVNENFSSRIVIIPNEYNGLPVTHIAEKSFYGLDIYLLCFGKNIKHCGASAFNRGNYDCTIYYDGTIEDWLNIEFANGSSNPAIETSRLYIKNNSNEYELLTTLEIPSTVKSIGSCQFYSYRGLEKIILPEGLEVISSNAFTRTKIEEVICPSTLTTIEALAFSECSKIKFIYIPKSVTSIKSLSFTSCEAYSFCEAESKPSSWNKATIPGYMFWGVSKDDFIIFDDSYYLINNENKTATLLKYFSDEETVEIPKYISFNNNSYKVNEIYSNAFRKLSNLTSVFLPDTIEKIRSNAFNSCENLKTITLDGVVKDINNNVATTCNSDLKTYYNTSFEVWFSLYSIQGYSNPQMLPNVHMLNEDNEYYLYTDLFLIEGTTTVNINLMNINNVIDRMYIPSSITSFNGSLFKEGKEIKEVYYNGTIEDWVKIQFSDRDSNPISVADKFYLLDDNNEYYLLTEVNIPHTVKNILTYAFYNYERITNVVIENGVEEIFNYAFEDCINIEEIILPLSINKIGFSAFYSKSNIECTVYYNGTMEDWVNITISSSATFKDKQYIYFLNEKNEYYLPEEVVINSSHGMSMGLIILSSVKRIILSDDIVKFDDFFGFKNAKEIYIPNSVTTITDFTIAHNRMMEIYCEAESKPDGWGEYWMQNCTVNWGVRFEDIYEVDDYRYILNKKDHTASILRYIGYKAVLDIPANIEVDGIIYDVNKIESNMLYNNTTVAKIIIPSSIDYIDAYAFNTEVSLKVLCEDSSIQEGWSEDWNKKITWYGYYNYSVIWDVAKNNEVVIDNIGYWLDTETTEASVVMCYGNSKIVDIPQEITVEGIVYKVVTILSDSFRYLKSLRIFFIPNTIKNIELNTFNFSKDIVILVDNNSESVEWGENWNNNNIVYWNANKKDIQILERNNDIYILDSINKTASLQYHSPERDVEIPSSVTKDGISYKVTEILPSAISNDKVMTIELPSTVQIIRDRAFYYCSNLLILYIPSSVTTVGETIYNNSLTRIVCQHEEEPEGFNKKWCYSYSKVYWGKTKNCYFIKDDIYYFIDQNNEIVLLKCLQSINNIVIEDKISHYGNEYKVVEIEKYAFSRVKVDSLSIPKSVETINYGALLYADISILSIPYIGLNRTDETNAYLGYIYGVSDVKNQNEVIDALKELIITDPINIYQNSVSNISTLETIRVLSIVEKIQPNAFVNCLNVKTFEVPSIASDKYDSSVDSYIYNIFGSFSSTRNDFFDNIIFNDGIVTTYMLGNLRGITNLYIDKNVDIICSFYNNIVSNFYFDGTVGDWCNIKNYMSFSEYDSIYFKNESNEYYLLETLIIPNTVTKINSNQFKGLNVEQIEIPNSVISINDSAFYSNTKLTKIIIPGSVTSVDYTAFDNCTNLKEIVFEDGVKGIKSSSNFKMHRVIELPNTLETFSFPKEICDELSIVYNGTLEEWVNVGRGTCGIPSNIIFKVNGEIKEYDEIRLPNGTTSIKEYCFANLSNISKIYIPTSVKTFATYSFYKMKDVDVYYDGTIEDWLEITISGSCSNPSIYAEHLYMKDDNGEYVELDKLIIPDGTTKIMKNQFSGFSKIKEVVIPNSVINIGESAFKSCYNLSTVTFESESKLEIIGSNAFENCTNLSRITLPQSVTTINSYAFSNCTNLRQIYFAKNIQNVGSDIFYSCSNVLILCEPESRPSKWDSKFAYYNHIMWSANLNNFVKENDFTYLVYPKNNYAVAISYDGTSEHPVINSHIVLNNQEYPVIIIQNMCFSDCEYVKSITIPNTITHIEDTALTGLDRLDAIYYEGDITSWLKVYFLESYSNPAGYTDNLYFKNDEGNYYIPKEIIIPDSVTSIHENAFYGFNSLEKIVLHANVKSIGSSALARCPNLRYLFIPSTISRVGYIDKDYLENTIILTDATSIPYDWKGLTKSDIYLGKTESDILITENFTYVLNKDNNTAILYHYFGDDKNITINGSVEKDGITYQVTTICKNAFIDNTLIEELTIEDGIMVIEEYAFAGCHYLKKVNSNSTLTTICSYAFDCCYSLIKFTNIKSVQTIENQAFRNCFFLQKNN